MPIDKRKYEKLIVGQVMSAQGYLVTLEWAAPNIADVDAALNDQATSNSVITTVLAAALLAQPDVPRNLTITPGGTTADVPAGDITITGTNYRDEAITEAITLLANASTIKLGNKAFKTVVSIAFPIQDGAAATYDVGYGDKLGLERKAAIKGALTAAVDGVVEGTLPTVAIGAGIESHTADFDTDPDGAADHLISYLSQEITDKAVI